uniref:Uncharacterized protein n=1 Tax=Setaria viridis TaxID=4556 RepID=A0A4U6USF1_SETVI|nr:hypothetical protein SEVIR_5G371450v2 [Setaria viridis]
MLTLIVSWMTTFATIVSHLHILQLPQLLYSCGE